MIRSQLEPRVFRPAVFQPAVLALVVASFIAVAAAQQVRDNPPVAAPGRASISGTVFLDGASKRPARRARVTLTSVERTSSGRTTTTDDRGAFSFDGVPAGRFELQAYKPGYLRASYGASRPNRAGTPIVVSEGQTIADLAMTMARGGVITGVVRDARGRPLPGVDVRVLKLGYHPVTGERTLAAQSTASTSTTDDRGEYRAYGLPPGGYLVLVPGPPPPGRSGFSGTDDIRPLTADDVRRAMQMAQSRTPAAIAAPAAGATVAPSTPGRVNYAPVFHPGVTNISAAATIALGVSEERTGVDVTVDLVPTATISGRINSPSGDLPERLSVSIVPAGADASMLAGAGLRGTSAQLNADGTYVASGVPPGAYTIKARTSLGGGRGGVPVPNAPTMWAAADVQVSGQDLEIPLTLQPGVPINGRVVFEGSQPPAAELQTLSFSLVALASGGTALWTGGGRVDAEGRFTFASVPPDTYQVVTRWTTPGAEDRWTIKSSTAKGRDAFESPLRIDPGQPVEWTVTFTDKPAVLTGALQDRGGRAATDYYVVVFSSDRTHWTPGSRRVRMTRPATDGAFVARGLPAGEYFVAAMTDLETGEWNDPALLGQLAAAAAKVTLRDGETTRQDFQIGGL
jgi:hypothetical protein